MLVRHSPLRSKPHVVLHDTVLVTLRRDASLWWLCTLVLTLGSVGNSWVRVSAQGGFIYPVLAEYLLSRLYRRMVWSLTFVPNMLLKDASMSRYPEWKAYIARSGMLIPQFGGGGAAPKGQ